MTRSNPSALAVSLAAALLRYMANFVWDPPDIKAAGGWLHAAAILLNGWQLSGVLRLDSGAPYDAILLDVDNGPEGLIRRANDALYNLKGLRAIRRALRPGGVLAFWSSGPNS
jgi:hypothetical protein